MAGGDDTRVARFFLIPKMGQIFQLTTTLPNGHKICIPNDCKILQMPITYTNILNSKALKNLPKFGFKMYHLATLYNTTRPRR
jgi:hypothetical protein